MTAKSIVLRVLWAPRSLTPALSLLVAIGCGQSGGTDSGAGGLQNGAGGAASFAGTQGSSGTQGSGGATAMGGANGSGGVQVSGGASGRTSTMAGASGASFGGTSGAGGTTGIGGAGGANFGGSQASGGGQPSGVTGAGGTVAPGSGGAPVSGGATAGNSGGTGSGGASGTGGTTTPGTGGTTAPGTGGTTAPGTGGTTTPGTGGTTTPGSGGTTATGTGGTTAPGTCDPALPSSGTYYVASANGTGSTCSASSPCSASTAIGKLAPGQTAYLRGGTYASINVSKSGSATDGNITVAAYPCELPIIDPGSVGISGTYVSIQGIVARNSAGGFGNGWTGSGTTNSNGHIEFINCIADMHSRNGIAFYSATGIHIRQCIVAHTGFSTTSSWSSAVNMYGVQGTYKDNIIEETVAFENADMQNHTDGSGFIVDDIGTGVTFVNNVGFRNGGSCIRLTTTTGTHIINNSCYNNGLDPAATGPSTPDEIFFSSSATTSGAVLYNNLAVATGKGGDTSAIFGSNGATLGNNVTNNTGAIDFWVDAAGTNPDFHLTSTATSVIGKGTSTEAPSEDIGFDPKCITKTAPTGTGVQPWWLYSIDYDYIKGIGGVAQCFHPKARSGAIDIGAYAN